MIFIETVLGIGDGFKPKGIEKESDVQDRKRFNKNISTQIVQIPNDVTSTVRLAVRNTGDIPIWDLTVNVFPGLQSALGINGLTPSAITSPNIPDSILYNPANRSSWSFVLWYR